MNNLITAELIKELYTKYDVDPVNGGGRDSWNVVADIINEILPRDAYPADSSFYAHVHLVWQLVNEYILSTYNE